MMDDRHSPHSTHRRDEHEEDHPNNGLGVGRQFVLGALVLDVVATPVAAAASATATCHRRTSTWRSRARCCIARTKAVEGGGTEAGVVRGTRWQFLRAAVADARGDAELRHPREKPMHMTGVPSPAGEEEVKVGEEVPTPLGGSASMCARGGGEARARPMHMRMPHVSHDVHCGRSGSVGGQRTTRRRDEGEVRIEHEELPALEVEPLAKGGVRTTDGQRAGAD